LINSKKLHLRGGNVCTRNGDSKEKEKEKESSIDLFARFD
jgi:hypothetical protein